MHAWPHIPKMVVAIWRNLWRRYCKDMQTSHFGYFEHAWLHKPKMIVPTCGRLWCLSTCQKYTSSSTSFLRYCILKNPAIWLTDNILAHNSRTRILPDMGLVVKYQQQYSFHFRLFPRKTNDKIFQKIKKPNFGAILGPFSWSKGLSVVRYSNYLPSYKKSAKTIEPFLRKTPSWLLN